MTTWNNESGDLLQERSSLVHILQGKTLARIIASIDIGEGTGVAPMSSAKLGCVVKLASKHGKEERREDEGGEDHDLEGGGGM